MLVMKLLWLCSAHNKLMMMITMLKDMCMTNFQLTL
jgi:hypothetical protein